MLFGPQPLQLLVFVLGHLPMTIGRARRSEPGYSLGEEAKDKSGPWSGQYSAGVPDLLIDRPIISSQEAQVLRSKVVDQLDQGREIADNNAGSVGQSA